jgi:hypothetical protein
MDKVNGLGVQSYCYRGTKGVPALIAAVRRRVSTALSYAGYMPILCSADSMPT